MIHFTVAPPFGHDSVFFSFVERLAVLNGHICVDPPAQQLDEADPGPWIDSMKTSPDHYFLIGYRYPPIYYKALIQSSSSVCMLVDPEAVARHVEYVRETEAGHGNNPDLHSAIASIQNVLQMTTDLAEYLLEENTRCRSMNVPAYAVAIDPHNSFGRIEKFYESIGVPIHTMTSHDFAMEALPLIRQRYNSVGQQVLNEIRKYLLMGHATPQRLEAVTAIFGI